MKANELLKPRFEVIEVYPKCKCKKGDILERVPNATNDWYNHDKSLIYAELLLNEIEKYPHLFRKLNWWEHRKKEDMPKRLVSLSDKDSEYFKIENQEVYEIVDWDMNGMMGFINDREVCDLELFTPEYGYIPVD